MFKKLYRNFKFLMEKFILNKIRYKQNLKYIKTLKKEEMYFEIYGLDSCLYCNLSKNLLKNNRFNFSYYPVSKKEHEDELNSILKEYFLVPQIFLNKKHVGGYIDLKKLIDNI